jgi:predicted O-methyltransferase YrrM
VHVNCTAGRVVSIERDWKWVLAAKRFTWQAAGGRSNEALRAQGRTPVGARVDVRWGDARKLLKQLRPPRSRSANVYNGREAIAGAQRWVDLLFLDGTPKETLEYLKAAEPILADGAVVIVDNAGVFQEGGMKPYLEYVRSSVQYESRYLESHFEWRPDVPDGLEVSTFRAGSAVAQ